MVCSVCHLPIAEEVSRSGPRPDSRECPFCLTVFSRVDGAKRHAKRCPQRGARALHPGKRGRKALACDRCSRVKVYCNARDQTPCEGCTSRKLACTFSRFCADAAHRQPVGRAPSGSPRRNRDRVPVSFLLNSTDDKQDFVTETAVGREPDGALLGPICVSPQRARAPDSETLDYIDPTLLLPSNCQPNYVPLQLRGMYNAEEDNLLGSFISSRFHGDRLAARIELLESYVHTYATSNDRYQDSFDMATFRRFFSVPNVYAFARTFCRKRHYRYPVIHWPTFDLEEASLPLLMVVSLTGATYSYRPGHESEHVNNARGLYSLADSYVFDQLGNCLDRLVSESDITEAIQMCQAALLMYGLTTLLAGDAAMQHTAITKRLPALISAMRKLNFLNCRHSVCEDWQLFLHREHVIRLVSWTFCADCLATLSCNNPPLFSILEMTGDLPCDPDLWNTDSSLGFELLRSSRQRPSHCLRDLMSNFLDDKSQLNINRDDLPLFHLHVLLCGLQQIIFNLHVTMVLPERSEKLLQTLSSWRHLWERAIEGIPDSQRNWLGVARNVTGIEYLSRRVIEVAVSPKASSSQYLQRIPSSSTRELHEFIRDFVAKT